MDYYAEEDLITHTDYNDFSSSYGAALDIGIDWQLNPEWFASLYVQDALSLILWAQAPNNVSHVSTIKDIEDGYYGGHVDYQDYQQSLPIKVNALISRKLQPNSRAYLQSYTAYESWIAQLGYEYSGDFATFRLQWFPLNESVGFELKHDYFNVQITGNPLDITSSELLDLQLGFSFPVSF